MICVKEKEVTIIPEEPYLSQNGKRNTSIFPFFGEDGEDIHLLSGIYKGVLIGYSLVRAWHLRTKN